MASRSLMPFSRNTQMSRWGEDTDPFLQMRREMNRLFDDVFSGFGGLGLPGAFGPALQQMPAAPKIDVSETENEIQIKAEMPGIDQNNVEVLLEDDRLIIRGEKKEEREDKDRNYHVRERVQGVFSRTLPLPFAPDPNQVKAEFKDGVMTITIPKPQEVKQKQHRIDVQKDTSTPSESTPSEPSVSRAGRPAGATTSSTASQSQAEQREKETAAG